MSCSLKWNRFRPVGDQFTDDGQSEKQTSASVNVRMECIDQNRGCKRNRGSSFEESTPDYWAGVIEDDDFRAFVNPAMVLVWRSSRPKVSMDPAFAYRGRVRPSDRGSFADFNELPQCAVDRLSIGKYLVQVRIDEHLIGIFLQQSFDVLAPDPGSDEFGRIFRAKPAGFIAHTLESRCESWV